MWGAAARREKMEKEDGKGGLCRQRAERLMRGRGVKGGMRRGVRRKG